MKDATISRERDSYVDDSSDNTGWRSIIGLTAGGTYDDVLIDHQRRIVLSPTGGTVIVNIDGDYIDNSAFTIDTDRGLAIGGIVTGGTVSDGDFGVLRINTDRELITHTAGGTLDSVTITTMPSVNVSGGTLANVHVTGGTTDMVSAVGGTVNVSVVGGTIIANIEGDYIDDSGFTVATDRGLAIGGIATSDAIDVNDFGVFRMDINRTQFVRTSGGTLDSLPRIQVLGGTLDSLPRIQILGGTLDDVTITSGNINITGGTIGALPRVQVLGGTIDLITTLTGITNSVSVDDGGGSLTVDGSVGLTGGTIDMITAIGGTVNVNMVGGTIEAVIGGTLDYVAVLGSISSTVDVQVLGGTIDLLSTLTGITNPVAVTQSGAWGINITGGTIDALPRIQVLGGTLDYITSVGGSINSRPMSTTPMYNEVNNVVGGAETTLLSHIVGGTPLYVYNIIATGTASAEYFLYMNGNRVMTSRTSTADRTSNLVFPGPIAATAGTLFVKVLHEELAQQDFRASVVYNT